MAKSVPPTPPDRSIRAQIEELRRQASADLEREANEPLSEKAKQDVVTLEAVDAIKH